MTKSRLGNRPAVVITKCYVWYRIMALYLNDRCVQLIFTSGSSSSQSINITHDITIAKKSFANGNFDSSLLIFQVHDWTFSVLLTQCHMTVLWHWLFPTVPYHFKIVHLFLPKFTKNYSKEEITAWVRGTLCENFFLRRSLKSQEAFLWTYFIYSKGNWQ